MGLCANTCLANLKVLTLRVKAIDHTVINIIDWRVGTSPLLINTNHLNLAIAQGRGKFSKHCDIVWIDLLTRPDIDINSLRERFGGQ